jgi:hypothetical protein
MTNARALPVLLLALLGPRSAATAPTPRVICHADGRCAVSSLPPALRDAEVLDYLKSGLTTTLAVSLNARGGRGQKLSATGRIDVRFEPWQEAFDVAVTAPGTATERRRLASETALHDWWRELALSFALAEAAQGSARVSVELIPFSEEEQADARRWYAENLRAAPEPGAATGAPGIGEVLDSLTLTSIKRQGVLRFSWSVAVERVR